MRLTDHGAELAIRFAEEVYAELETLLAPLSDRDQRRFSELAGVMIARQPSPFAARP